MSSRPAQSGCPDGARAEFFWEPFFADAFVFVARPEPARAACFLPSTADRVFVFFFVIDSEYGSIVVTVNQFRHASRQQCWKIGEVFAAHL